jgi:hypothetical protein
LKLKNGWNTQKGPSISAGPFYLPADCRLTTGDCF